MGDLRTRILHHLRRIAPLPATVLLLQSELSWSGLQVHLRDIRTEIDRMRERGLVKTQLKSVTYSHSPVLMIRATARGIEEARKNERKKVLHQS